MEDPVPHLPRIPGILVTGALSGVLLVLAFLAWFSALVTGRMPTGLRNLGALPPLRRADIRVRLIVTDRYPYASPALRPPPEPEPVYADPFLPAPEAV